MTNPTIKLEGGYVRLANPGAPASAWQDVSIVEYEKGKKLGGGIIDPQGGEIHITLVNPPAPRLYQQNDYLEYSEDKHIPVRCFCVTSSLGPSKYKLVAQS